MYASACGLVEDRRPDGWVHLVAHVGRELTNRLGDFLPDVPVAEGGGPSPLRPQRIAERLQKAMDLGDEELRAAAHSIVDDVAEGSRMPDLRAAALIAAQSETADDASVDAWVRAWRALHGTFQSLAHVGSSTVSGAREDRLRAAWLEMTDLLAARLAREPFFFSMDELLELAAGPPDGDRARRALARLRPGTRAEFYAALEDPGWVEALRGVDAFKHPPDLISDDEFVRYPEWPEGLVLLRFAKSDPGSVVRAAAEVPRSDNVRVAQILATVAAELPPELVADHGLASRVARDLRGDTQLLNLGEPAAKLATRLVEAGRRAKACEILDALLRVDVKITPSGVDHWPDFRHGFFRHDEYLLSETARPLVASIVDAEPEATIKTLITSLRHAQSKLAYGDSTHWRQEIGGTRAPSGEDPRHLLVELLRDACAQALAQDVSAADRILDLLQEEESEIFARLAWYLLADLPDQAARRRSVLTNPSSLFSHDGTSEIAATLPVGFAELQDDDRRALLEVIFAGPDPADHGLDRDQSEDACEMIDRWQDRWRQWLLGALEPLLDTEAKARLAELRQKRGRLDPPGGAVKSTSWIGPTSPVSRTKLPQMTSDEVLSLLAGFRAEESFASPTPEGLAREIAAAVKADPARWMWMTNHISELAPTYARGWLSGLLEAVREGRLLPESPSVLAALQWLLDQSAEPGNQLHSRDGDPDHYQAQRTGADLLIAALARNQIELDDRDLVWSLITRLTENPDPTPDRESADTEPVQIAWSSLRALGTTALIQYLHWLDRRLPAEQGPGARGFTAAPETQAVLERLRREDQSQGIRAALASELPVLTSLDSDWLSANVETFADPDGDELARVGWDAYLRYAARYQPSVLTLADAYRRAAAAASKFEGELTPHRRELADHVAVIWRDLPNTVPDLLAQFMASAPDPDRARVISTLGRSLRPQEDVFDPTDHDLERFRSLWDERLADDPGPLELAEYGWWWTSGRLTDAADLRRLTATVTRGAIGSMHLRTALGLLDQLLAADPELTGDALALLEVLGDQETLGANHVDPDVLRRLIKPALASADLRERAIALVHRLGEQGYITLRGLLD